MSLIKRPNSASMLRARISDLESENRELQGQLTEYRTTADDAILYAQSLEAELDCEDCSDSAALARIAQKANYSVMRVQSRSNNELCQSHWRDVFRDCGQSQAYCHIKDMFASLLCEREYQLAIANHNIAFCRAEGASDAVAASIEALEQILADNPDMDPCCRSFIMENIAIADA